MAAEWPTPTNGDIWRAMAVLSVSRDQQPEDPRDWMEISELGGRPPNPERPSSIIDAIVSGYDYRLLGASGQTIQPAAWQTDWVSENLVIPSLQGHSALIGSTVTPVLKVAVVFEYETIELSLDGYILLLGSWGIDTKDHPIRSI